MKKNCYSICIYVCDYYLSDQSSSLFVFLLCGIFCMKFLHWGRFHPNQEERITWRTNACTISPTLTRRILGIIMTRVSWDIKEARHTPSHSTSSLSYRCIFWLNFNELGWPKIGQQPKNLKNTKRRNKAKTYTLSKHGKNLRTRVSVNQNVEFGMKMSTITWEKYWIHTSSREMHIIFLIHS